MRKGVPAGLCLLLVLVVCSSWGFLVHRTIHQLAIYELPGSLQRFFYHNMDYVVKYSVRPDQRRNEDSTEATKHFIDLEAYGDSAAWKMPVHWHEAVARYSRDTLLKYGYVPYYVIMIKDNLTRAFRNGQADSVLFYATDMAHYISDAHVPLHTTLNYDGQLTGQRGLHSLWETVVPEIELAQYNLHSRHKARYLQHPEQDIRRAVQEAWLLVDDVLAQEKAASLSFTDSTKYRVQVRNGREYRSYTSQFAKAYSERLGNTINRQLIRSADMVADFWYTCWVDAGKPDMDKWLKPSYNKEEKLQLRRELKAYRKNKLIEEELLLARKKDK